MMYEGMVKRRWRKKTDKMKRQHLVHDNADKRDGVEERREKTGDKGTKTAKIFISQLVSMKI